MTTKTNNLWTRVRELEAELAAARRSLRDDVAIAAVTGIFSQPNRLFSTNNGYYNMAKDAMDFADAFMIERDKR